MGPQRLRIQMLGLLPAILKPCGPACAQPFMNANVRALVLEELRETPPFLRENSERAHDLAERLFKDFGRGLEIEVVGLDSPKGFWMGLRHRVGKGFAVIVDGREVLRDPHSYEEAKAAIERAVRARDGRSP